MNDIQKKTIKDIKIDKFMKYARSDVGRRYTVVNLDSGVHARVKSFCDENGLLISRFMSEAGMFYLKYLEDDAK